LFIFLEMICKSYGKSSARSRYQALTRPMTVRFRRIA
jgi:hypothetical protein